MCVQCIDNHLLWTWLNEHFCNLHKSIGVIHFQSCNIAMNECVKVLLYCVECVVFGIIRADVSAP